MKKAGEIPRPVSSRSPTFSVDQLGIDLSHVASLTALDDLNGLFSAEETIHRASARLLQILVVLPVVGGLFLPVLTEIFLSLIHI